MLTILSNSCKRCAKAGRTCLGYARDEDLPKPLETQSKPLPQTLKATKSGKGNSSSSVARSSLITSGLPVRLPTANSLEARFLEYFYTRTASSISGFFDFDFYSRILLQAGQYEPAVRHAMMAVGAMHEHFEFSLVPTFSRPRPIQAGNEKPAFALHQYNKAISEINDQLCLGSGSIESVLMCCLLFVCLDCLRGETASAVSHLRSGGNIITNWKPPDKRPHLPADSAYSSLTTSSMQTDSSFVTQHLLPIFERLSCHVDGAGRVSHSEFANLINPVMNAEGTLDSRFYDIDEARAAIMNLGSVTIRLIRGIAFTKYSQDPSEDEVRAVAGLKRKLQRWREYMDNLLDRQPELKHSRRAVVLNVQHRLFSVIAATSLPLEQGVNDRLTDDFAFIVEHSESLSGDPDSRIPAASTERDLQTFSLEEGVAPACFYTASKCRVPHLRRRAIRSLQSGPRRQGIWNAVLLARVANRIIELEEGFVPSSQAIHRRLSSHSHEPVAGPALAFIPPSDATLSDLPLTPESLSSTPEESIPVDCHTPNETHADETSSSQTEARVESPLPPECARIHHADIKESPNGSPYQHIVTFFRKPNGLDKDWQIWTEQISI